jgi:ATP-dependent helicase/nuclease subunit B
VAVNLPRLAVLVGPAGIGKTRFLLENFSRLVQESDNPFRQDVLLILPTAEHRERMVDLMLRKEGSGFFGERVTTLSRLMQEFLKAGDFSWATDVERRFLLTEILAEKGGAYFQEVATLPGFLEKMSDFVGELKESLVSLEDLRKGVAKLKKTFPETAEKYETLLQIHEAYEKRLTALGYRDRRDALSLLKEIPAGKKGKAHRFRHLFLDGFFDFSPSQLEFLRWLSERSERVTLTLSVDPSRKEEGLFEIPFETLKELEALGFEVVPFEGKTNERATSPELRQIEANLFREEAKAGALSTPETLLILEATGIRGEVEMIAREIRKRVRAGNLNFSDIAVILRRIGEYQEMIRTVFRDFEIPVEIHERERLRDTALARTAASFFRVLLDDWKREDLFNFLKSSYVERNYGHVCSLEIRSLDLGIVGGRERWLKEIGDPLFDKIAGCQEKTQEERPVNEWIRFTRDFLRSFGLTKIPFETDEATRRDFATLKRFESLLEEIRRACLPAGRQPSGQNRKMRFETFAREFLGLLEVDLFSLHDRDKNRVQVYDVSLSRQKEYKVVFLAGLLEKFFPAEIREDPILSDRERRVLGLKERLPRQALERYFFYLGLTRAREALVLSYPRFDLEGHEALPSFYVDEVKKLFSGELPKRSYPVSQSLPRLEDAVEEREVEAHLIEGLFKRGGAREKKARALTLGLYNRLLGRPSFQALFPRILFDTTAQIRDERIRAAFLPKGGIFNPTSFQTYGGCPYRYFASRVLGLEEMEEGIDPREVGILLHKVLETYWRERVEKKKKELEDLEKAKAFVTEKLEALLKEKPLSGERKYRVELKVAEMKEWLSRMVKKEIEEGSPLKPLAPRHFEFGFGFNPKEVDYLRLFDPHREDLKLRGKIDRIDVDPSGKYAVVIDYKTGGSFKRQDLEFGRALQLPLYLLAIQKLLKLKPVAGEIYKIRDAKSSGFYAKEALEEIGVKVRSKNVLSQKEFDQVIERAVRFAFKYADGITKAEIPVRPRDCDKNCPFPSVCRIEKWRLPFIYEELREEDKQSGII